MEWVRSYYDNQGGWNRLQAFFHKDFVHFEPSYVVHQLWKDIFDYENKENKVADHGTSPLTYRVISSLACLPWGPELSNMVINYQLRIIDNEGSIKGFHGCLMWVPADSIKLKINIITCSTMS